MQRSTLRFFNPRGGFFLGGGSWARWGIITFRGEHPAFIARSPDSTLLPLFGEGSPTKIEYRKNGYRYLEDLDKMA